MMKQNKISTLYDEHILLHHLEESNIPSYQILKEVDPFNVPVVLDFFNIIAKYLKMSTLLTENK